jgi:hypothetical protein
MSNAIKVATLIQIGKESTRGTPVAATRKILTKASTFRILETLEEFEGQMHGTLARTAMAPLVVRNGTEFQVVTDLDFEQVLLPLLSGVKGGVTPTTPGTGEARLWTFTPSVTADPLPTTYTIEYAERDMDASPNELGLEAPYGFATGFEIGGGLDQLPQLTIDMVARKTGLAASTGALALPTLNVASNLRWKVTIDSTWANLGTTQITGQVYGFAYKFSGFLAPAYYLDNRSDLDFSQYEFNPRMVDLTMDVTLGAASGDLVPTEDGNKSAGTMRFVRLELLGGAFDSPDNGRNRIIRLDGAYFHAMDSMQDRGADNEGNAVTRLHLLSTYDSTQAQDVEMVVENNLTAFP